MTLSTVYTLFTVTQTEEIVFMFMTSELPNQGLSAETVNRLRASKADWLNGTYALAFKAGAEWASKYANAGHLHTLLRYRETFRQQRNFEWTDAGWCLRSSGGSLFAEVANILSPSGTSSMNGRWQGFWIGVLGYDLVQNASDYVCAGFVDGCCSVYQEALKRF